MQITQALPAKSQKPVHIGLVEARTLKDFNDLNRQCPPFRPCLICAKNVRMDKNSSYAIELVRRRRPRNKIVFPLRPNPVWGMGAPFNRPVRGVHGECTAL